ncbi:MAG: PBP1A family penicillin-binding protein [Gammaproteobacteria bacterium]|nr:PBP1A family penicillin-binding protein [Gammaproteobacteria bacterium]
MPPYVIDADTGIEMQQTTKSRRNMSPLARRRLMRALVLILGLGGATTIGTVAGIIGAYYFAAPALPAAETIREIPLEVPLRIYSRDGFLISEVGERKRIPITYEDVPEHVVQAFVAAEDRRFFVHHGIDYRGVTRAIVQLLLTGEISGGGSTLTQQLARSYFLSLEQSFVRKMREAFLAYRIEQEFSKEQIMTFFLNKMFFGQRAYGVAAASQVYFNKSLRDINIAEAATLAGVLPAPSRKNPVTDPVEATVRRGYVLGRMLDLDFIDQREYDEAMAVPMQSTLYGAAIELNADYVAEMVRRDMLNRFGSDAYTAGYQVVTTLDSRLQRAANYALHNGLLGYTRRRGYRGPITNLVLPAETIARPLVEWPVDAQDLMRQYAPGGLSVALVTAVNPDNSVAIVLSDGTRESMPWGGISWAKPFIDRQTTGQPPESAGDVLAVGDLVYVMPTTAGSWALAQVPEVQGAIVSVDPHDGAIGSLAGGFDFALSKFNRAVQAFRQPGSSFKPFIYSAALEYGSTAATVILDTPVVITSSELEAVWRPTEYSGRFYGPTRVREALVRSMNLVSVRLLLFETGIGNAVRHIAKFGFGDAALPRNGSLALGAGSASPLDLVQGYAVFANGGYGVKPYVIDAIYDAAGEIKYHANPLIVCPECLVEPGPDLLQSQQSAGQQEQAVESLDFLFDNALEYRADASTDPELFADVNAAPRVISAQNAFLMQDMMRDVIRRGTGRRALVLGRKDLSGKTGTSNDFRDAWFAGFNSDLAAVAWVGYDDDLPLGPGEEGSRTALPLWIDFMRFALRGVAEHQMPMPEGIVSVRIDSATGCPARAGQRNAIFEMFREGHVPTCTSAVDPGDIFNNASGTDAAQPGDEPEGEESLF